MKQHELLAVESDTNRQAVIVANETRKVFNDSSNCDENVKTYHAYTEGDKDIGEESQKKMKTTVAARLKYHSKSMIKSLNMLTSKERTNAVAMADIVVFDEDTNDETVIATNVPVCALLSLEKKLNEQRLIYSEIPTFAAQINWVEGFNMAGEKCYVQEQIVTVRTRTEIVTESFEQHNDSNSKLPRFIPRDKKKLVPCGEYTVINKTGRMSPKEKADVLANIDALIAAVKIARSKANTIEVVQEKELGKALFDFINS